MSGITNPDDFRACTQEEPENDAPDVRALLLNGLAGQIHRNAVAKGFWEERMTIPDADALVNDLLGREWEPKVKAALPEIIALIEARMVPADRNDGECIALMGSELSEALEAFRKGNPPDHHCPEFDNATVEFADCIIRILDLCGARDMPIGEALLAKMRFNATRPHKHGKAF